MFENGIKGTELCCRNDGYGEIIVAEESGRRMLYFGRGVLQSTIRIDRPDLLLEDYNQAMMSGLLFNHEPRRVLLIGLGGCSLVHFLLKAVPACSIDVVEIRRLVIDLSLEFFLLPADHPQVRIVHASGADFIRQRGANSEKYDMIILDAFDDAGPAVSLLEKDFLAACRTHLSAKGVFVMNAWNSPSHNFSRLYHSIQAAFDNNALKLLLTESYRNAVAFGFQDPAACRNLPARRAGAAKLQARHRIDFPRYLKYLYWQNFNDQDQ